MRYHLDVVIQPFDWLSSGNSMNWIYAVSRWTIHLKEGNSCAEGCVPMFPPIFWNICYNINFAWTNNSKASYLFCGSWILCVRLFWLFWTFIILERPKTCSTFQLLWIFLRLSFHLEDASTILTEVTGATGETHQMKLFSKKK